MQAGLSENKSSRLITADGDPRGSPLRSHSSIHMMGPCLNMSLTVHHQRRRCSNTATVSTFEHCTVEEDDEVLQKHICSLLLASASPDGDFVQFVEKLLTERFVHSKVSRVHLITFS